MKKQLHSLMILLALSGVTLLATGCDMKLPPMPWDPPKPAEKPGEAAGEQASPAGDGGGETSEPLDPNALLPPAMRHLPYEEVTIPMLDRVNIYGRLYNPSLKPEDEEGNAPAASTSDNNEDSGPKYPLVILLPGLNRDYTAWGDLPATLVKAGYAVFAMDLRGQGKSTRTTSGRRLTWRLFTKEEWRLLPKDVTEVIRYFQKSEDYPAVDGKHLALVGEKLGANVAVYAASENTEILKALVVVSPGLDYKGLMPSQVILDVKSPVLLLTSQDDDYSNQSTHGLYNWITGPKTLLEYGRIGDGAEMLQNRPAIGNALRDWLLKTLPSGQAVSVPSLEASLAEPTAHGENPAGEKPSAEKTPSQQAPHAKDAKTDAHEEAHPTASAHETPKQH